MSEKTGGKEQYSHLRVCEAPFGHRYSHTIHLISCWNNS